MQLVIKLHSRCNLNCTYCYMYNKGDESYRDKPKRLPFAVIERLPEMIQSYMDERPNDRISICFHGGEPLLVGKAYFRQMMEFLLSRIPEQRIAFSLQTNATLIDDQWISILERYPIAVAASLDGPPEVNDQMRIYSSGRGSARAAISGIRRLRASNVRFAGVICVVNPTAYGGDIVDFFIDELKLEWFDFLLPDYTHDDLPHNWNDVQHRVGAFLTSAYDRWLERLSDGVSCRFFESVLAPAFGSTSLVDTIGKDGVSAVVLETDGTLEPHDLARMCAQLDRRTGIAVKAGALQAIRASMPYIRLQNESGMHAQACLECSHFNVCRGGHLFHRYSRRNGFHNPSVHCAALKGFIQHAMDKMASRLSAIAA